MNVWNFQAHLDTKHFNMSICFFVQCQKCWMHWFGIIHFYGSIGRQSNVPFQLSSIMEFVSFELRKFKVENCHVILLYQAQKECLNDKELKRAIDCWFAEHLSVCMWLHVCTMYIESFITWFDVPASKIKLNENSKCEL